MGGCPPLLSLLLCFSLTFAGAWPVRGRVLVGGGAQMQEASLAAKLWKARPQQCASVGRELVRRLRQARAVGEFNTLWTQLRSPGGVSGITYESLLRRRTPKALIRSMVTPDMEKQLLFVMKNVRLGNQNRYQKWFAQRCVCAIVCPLCELAVFARRHASFGAWNVQCSHLSTRSGSCPRVRAIT